MENSELELMSAVEKLRSQFIPQPGFQTSRVIWEPVESDPHYRTKRVLIARAQVALRQGNETLSGAVLKATAVDGGVTATEVSEALEGDAEQSAYVGLVHAIAAVDTLIAELQSNKSLERGRDR